MRMFWTALIGAALMLVGSIGLARAQDAELFKQQDEMFTPTVQIRVETNIFNTYKGLCSGSVIESKRDEKTGDVTTLVLTAKHCTDSVDERMQVISYDHSKDNREIKQNVWKAKVCGRSWKSDLALIKLDDKQTFFEKTAKVAEKGIALNFGDDVDLVGYPSGLGLTWTTGKLGYVEDTHGLAFDDVSQSTEFYRATPMMTGGSSGSPLFYKDADGTYKIIGVLTGGALQYLGFYTPVEEINAYLDTALEGCGLPSDKTVKSADATH
ncbi:MAG: S1 family peptidase [Rhizobiaceae bacterium]